MDLKRGIPEILGKAVLAGEEADTRDLWIGREGERERHLDRRAVGALGLALNIEHLVVTNPGVAEGSRVRLRIAAFEHHHRQSLPARKGVAVERPEGKEPRSVRCDLRRLRDRE